MNSNFIALRERYELFLLENKMLINYCLPHNQAEKKRAKQHFSSTRPF